LTFPGTTIASRNQQSFKQESRLSMVARYKPVIPATCEVEVGGSGQKCEILSEKKKKLKAKGLGPWLKW
jgi:hypothetical protein